MAHFPARGPACGFDFTLHMRQLCCNLAWRLPELSHIDMERVAIRFCQARRRTLYGVQATLTPLRFENGRPTDRRRGRQWKIDRIVDGTGQDMLYLLSFYLPRFLDQPLADKLDTVIHELWHISPQFDGDLRRHAGRCYAHSHSQRQYDAFAHALVLKWLRLEPPAECLSWLDQSFRQLKRAHGSVFGCRLPTPKLRTTR